MASRKEFREAHAARRAEIVRLHTDDKMTYRQIAAKFGITPQRVGQIVKPVKRNREP